MSLLSEISSTVIQSQIFQSNNLTVSKVNNPENVEAYDVLVGYAVPRTDTYMLLVDDKGQTLKMPSNTCAVLAVLQSITPLVSADVENDKLYVIFSNNTSFGITQTFVIGTNLAQVNLGSSLYAVQNDQIFKFYADHPYIGLYKPDGPITSGSVQVYIYYVTAPSL